MFDVIARPQPAPLADDLLAHDPRQILLTLAELVQISLTEPKLQALAAHRGMTPLVWLTAILHDRMSYQLLFNEAQALPGATTAGSRDPA